MPEETIVSIAKSLSSFSRAAAEISLKGIYG